jgi:hypothetical protein
VFGLLGGRSITTRPQLLAELRQVRERAAWLENQLRGADAI